MAKLWWKLKWLVFFWDTVYVHTYRKKQANFNFHHNFAICMWVCFRWSAVSHCQRRLVKTLYVLDNYDTPSVTSSLSALVSLCLSVCLSVSHFTVFHISLTTTICSVTSSLLALVWLCLSIYLSKKSRLRRHRCRDTTRAPNNVH